MPCHRRHLCCLEIQAPALILALSEWRYALPPSAACWAHIRPSPRGITLGFLWNVCFTLVRATFCHPNVCFTVVRAAFCLRNVCFTVVRATFCLRNVCFTMVRATFWRCLNGDMPCHRCGSSALKSKRPHSFWRCPSGDMPCHRCGSTFVDSFGMCVLPWSALHSAIQMCVLPWSALYSVFCIPFAYTSISARPLHSAFTILLHRRRSGDRHPAAQKMQRRFTSCISHPVAPLTAAIHILLL